MPYRSKLVRTVDRIADMIDGLARGRVFLVVSLGPASVGVADVPERIPVPRLRTLRQGARRRSQADVSRRVGDHRVIGLSRDRLCKPDQELLR